MSIRVHLEYQTGTGINGTRVASKVTDPELQKAIDVIAKYFGQDESKLIKDEDYLDNLEDLLESADLLKSYEVGELQTQVIEPSNNHLGVSKILLGLGASRGQLLDLRGQGVYEYVMNSSLLLDIVKSYQEDAEMNAGELAIATTFMNRIGSKVTYDDVLQYQRAFKEMKEDLLKLDDQEVQSLRLYVI